VRRAERTRAAAAAGETRQAADQGDRSLDRGGVRGCMRRDHAACGTELCTSGRRSAQRPDKRFAVSRDVTGLRARHTHPSQPVPRRFSSPPPTVSAHLKFNLAEWRRTTHRCALASTDSLNELPKVDRYCWLQRIIQSVSSRHAVLGPMSAPRTFAHANNAKATHNDTGCTRP
jgi:hypothetical protein